MDRDPMEKAMSTDVVMDNVLRHLKVRDLLSCRLASKCWNKSASSVLRRRSTMTKKISGEYHLMELQACMDQSLDFPFAGLKFDEPWRLYSRLAMKFFKKYGERFTRLRLDTYWVKRLHDLAPFIFHLPRLSILEVGQPYTYPPLWINWLNFSVRQKRASKILKLPSLRTIRLSSPCPEVDWDVLYEVLAATGPSLRIECLDAKPKILRLLKGAEKLRALSFIKFDEDYGNREHALEMDRLFSTEPPSLNKLEFSPLGCVPLEGLKKLLSSSQNTLQELILDEMCPPEFWDFVVLPKLTKLSVRLDSELWSFLYHRSDAQNFPALKELHLGVTYCYLGNGNVGNDFSDGLFLVPSVTTIDLDGCVDELGMERLAQSFPNVTEMRMNYSCYSNILLRHLVNASDIWTAGKFKCLEKLKIWNYQVRRPSRDYINMDSFLTGIPVEMCENLRKQKQRDPIYSPDTEALRCNPSVLQLENLKELVVSVKPENGWKQLPAETPFVSMVSVKYALEMMPNLRTKFVYENPSPPSVNAERDIAALEDAFKDVQPYVKLERFFY